MKRNPSTIAVGHVGLNVSNIEVSAVFYRDVFGFTIARESIEGPFGYASMAQDGRIVLTLWEQRGGRFKKHRPGLHHLAFEAASLEELNRTKGLLDNLGMHWGEGVATHAEGSSLDVVYFEDPDGIRMEVYGAAGVATLHRGAAKVAA